MYQRVRRLHSFLECDGLQLVAELILADDYLVCDIVQIKSLVDRLFGWFSRRWWQQEPRLHPTPRTALARRRLVVVTRSACWTRSVRSSLGFSSIAGRLVDVNHRNAVESYIHSKLGCVLEGVLQ